MRNRASFPRAPSVSSSQLKVKSRAAWLWSWCFLLTSQLPKMAASSLPEERLPKRNPGQGSRPAHITGKVLKGCKQTAKPILSPNLLIPSSSHSPRHSPQATSVSGVSNVCSKFTYITAEPMQLTIQDNLLINSVKTMVWNTYILPFLFNTHTQTKWLFICILHSLVSPFLV